MTYLSRKIDTFLVDWKNNPDRKPLIVKGPRQVGKGALYENVVGEALAKSGFGLYYFKRDDSTLEEDFFVRTASNLIPVERKSKVAQNAYR